MLSKNPFEKLFLYLWLKPQADRFKPVQTGLSRNRIHPVWCSQTQVLTCGEICGVLWGVIECTPVVKTTGWQIQTCSNRFICNRIHPVWCWQTQVLTCGEICGVLWGVIECTPVVKTTGWQIQTCSNRFFT